MFNARHCIGCWEQSRSSRVSLKELTGWWFQHRGGTEKHVVPSGGPLLRTSCRLLQSGAGWGKVNQFPRAALTNCHKVFSLKWQKLILSQLWRLAVWNHGVGGLVLSAGERNRPWQSPSFRCCGNLRHSLACRCTTPVSASVFLRHSSLCVLFCS